MIAVVIKEVDRVWSEDVLAGTVRAFFLEGLTEIQQE